MQHARHPAPPAARLFCAITCVFACAFGLAAAASAADAPKPPPLEAFFKHGDIGEAVLSPSGRWLAMVVPNGERRTLAVVDVSGKEPPKIVASYADADIRSAQWMGDHRLLFDTIDMQRALNDQKFARGLFVVERTGGNITELISPTGARFQTGSNIVHKTLDWNHVLLNIPPGEGDEIIVGELRADARNDVRGVNALRLNVTNHQQHSLSYQRPDNVIRWLFDPQGEPRLVVAENEGRETVYWRAAGQDGWRRIAEFSAIATDFTPIMVDGAGQLFVTTASGPRGMEELKRFDFASGQPEKEPLVSTPGFDFAGHLRLDAVTYKAIGVQVTTDAVSTVWFDPAMKALQKTVDTKLPGRVNVLDCKQCNTPEAVVLVYSWSDQEPGSYWLYRPSNDSWTGVGRARNDIEPRRMGQLDMHRIQARDGEDLPVWVTTPPKYAMPPEGSLPAAVVLVHGGPSMRGTSWQWNADAQFLATRGYVVIEPEFRGSTGYGSRHERLGWKHWGDTMQDDLADAVQWAAGQHLIDPKRVCLAGASYGGYATLMSLARYPDAYRCGVAWVAVTDPRLLYLDTWESDASAEQMAYGLPAMVGDLTKDAALLVAAAPVEQAAKIKAPLLLAFGSEDRRVPLVHGSRMRAALRDAGNDPEWVVYAGEGHGWLKSENTYDFWSRVDRFLAKNLAAPAP